MEDFVGAGSILAAMEGSASPETRVAINAFEEAKKDDFSGLRKCASSRELIEKGFEGDVTHSFDHDASESVIELIDGAYTKLG